MRRGWVLGFTLYVAFFALTIGSWRRRSVLLLLMFRQHAAGLQDTYRQIPSHRQQQREGRVLPTLATGPIRAVLLDVDGTLYHQERLRSFMALELVLATGGAECRVALRMTSGALSACSVRCEKACAM